MLSHKNMLHPVHSVPKVYGFDHRERTLSVLPIWHIFERAIEYVCIGMGSGTYYTNIRNLTKDFQAVKPTFMGSAPRLWEFVYQKIMDQITKSSPAKRTIFKLAIHASHQVKEAERFFGGHQFQIFPDSFSAKLIKSLFHTFNWFLWLIPALLLSFIPRTLRNTLGGELKATVSGGGALPFHIDEFFSDIGISVLEGYGMTETTSAITARTFENKILGSVGVWMPETIIQIRNLDNQSEVVPCGQKGVVYAKGPQIMKGYYKNPEETQKTIIDGWINTGDMGILTHNNVLKLTGRAKDTIVLTSGENIEPVPIENTLNQSPLISQNMVVGQDKKQLGALIVLDEDGIEAWLKEEELSASSPEYQDRLTSRLAKEIKTHVSAQTGFKSFELVKEFRIIEKPFEVGDELTNLFKIKRHIVTGKYQETIDSMYS